MLVPFTLFSELSCALIFSCMATVLSFAVLVARIFSYVVVLFSVLIMIVMIYQCHGRL